MSETMRGVVVTSPFHMLGPPGTLNEAGQMLEKWLANVRAPIGGVAHQLDPDEVRSVLLFWDRLDFPSHPTIRSTESPEEQLLKAEGILERTSTMPWVTDPDDLSLLSLIPGSEPDLPWVDNFDELLRRGQLRAFQEHEQREPGLWTVAHRPEQPFFASEHLTPGRGVLVRLYDALAVPHRDVPLQEVLEFRERYRSELLALRYHLDGIYQRIIAAGDGPLALQSEVERLSMALADHMNAARAARIRLRLLGVDAQIGLEANPIGAATRAGVLFASGFGAVSAALGGLLTSVAPKLELTSGAGLVGRENAASPFEYVSRFVAEMPNP